MSQPPIKVRAQDAPERKRASSYPPVFAQRMEGRSKRPLGDLFGLTQFGVNLTRLAPGAVSALMHAHTRQDEFVYVLEGVLHLVTESGEARLEAGDCAGFKAGGAAHQIVNRSERDGVYLEIGDRGPGDSASYPQDDLVARWIEGGWRFFHKDGQPYPDNQA